MKKDRIAYHLDRLEDLIAVEPNWEREKTFAVLSIGHVFRVGALVPRGTEEEEKMMKLLLLFFGQMVNFIIATFGYRAASHGRMLLTGGADFLFCMVNFVLIQRIAEAKNTKELLAYACGGAIGSMIAIRLTKHWKH